jgi:hypothetical protein
MTVKLLFRHGGKNGFDNCWIEMLHDLLTKKGNVFNKNSSLKISKGI